jgi:CRISPR-associated endonuclease/helicase Cas3
MLSLEPMELGLDPVGNYSWSERMLRLRDKAEYGPFRLAFLETLLRVADMRASKTESSRLELEGRENARD